MSGISVLVLSGYGLNCDHETAHAFKLAGANSVRVHINSLIDGSHQLENFHILVFVGGFSWGDDHGAGVIQAVRLRRNLGDRLLEFVEKGNLVIGICNGFQTLVNLGLLPGCDHNYRMRSVALTFNDCGNFRDDWVNLKVNPNSPCIFTKGFEQIELPVRHGEGKFYADPAIIDRLIQNNQVVIQYSTHSGEPANKIFPYNPNGSIQDIAGICDPTGRIFGLMPHPEAYNHWTNHPDWTRNYEKLKRRGKKIETALTPGIRILKNAVDFIRNR
ncbi:MAG: phosphoribosylformylglycinamidine synthase I [Desulfobacterales bacterium]|nr:phosphoribosylformylglycinamidine synthase I [Desulfobacterales bacterium]